MHRRKSSNHQINAALAALSAVFSYLFFRNYFEAQIRLAGLVSGGMLQYDSFYSLSFARELLRTDNWFLFRNPFGTLDSEPHLFNGMATLLALFRSAWINNLHLFDFMVSGIGSAVSGWFFGRWMSQCSRQSFIFTVLWTQMTILGSGFGFVFTFLLGSRQMLEPLLNGSYWGLSWLMSSIATWEILYHAVFWFGVDGIARESKFRSITAALILLWLHPFTLSIYALFAVAFYGLDAIQARTLRTKHLSSAVMIAGMFVFAAVVYNYILPMGSNDAKFFLGVYRNAYGVMHRLQFSIIPSVLISFLFPAILSLLICWLLRNREESAFGRNWMGAAGLLSACVLVALNLSYLLTDAVIQPAHWLRVYPIAFIMGAAVSFPVSGELRQKVIAASIGFFLFFVAVLDSVVGAKVTVGALIQSNGPPSMLDRDLSDLIRELNLRKAWGFLYLRGCTKLTNSTEYAVSALTQAQVPFGHVYFSPFGKQAFDKQTYCGRCPKLKSSVGPRPVIVLDHELALRCNLKSEASFGRFDIAAVDDALSQ